MMSKADIKLALASTFPIQPQYLLLFPVEGLPASILYLKWSGRWNGRAVQGRGLVSETEGRVVFTLPYRVVGGKEKPIRVC